MKPTSHTKLPSILLLTLSTIIAPSLSFAEVTKSEQPAPQTTNTNQTNNQQTRSVNTTKKDTKSSSEDVGSSMKSVGVTIVTSIMPTVSTKLSTGDSKKDKIVIKAKDDAATFIASKGQNRGAYLQAAILELRKDIPESQASDMQLAKAILTL